MPDRGVRERIVGRGTAFDERARAELGVPFPLEAQVAEVVHEMLGACARRGHAEAFAEGFDDAMRALRVVTDVDGEVGHPGRRLEHQEGPGVDLARECEPLGMVQGCRESHGTQWSGAGASMVSQQGLRTPCAGIIRP